MKQIASQAEWSEYLTVNREVMNSIPDTSRLDYMWSGVHLALLGQLGRYLIGTSDLIKY